MIMVLNTSTASSEYWERNFPLNPHVRLCCLPLDRLSVSIDEEFLKVPRNIGSPMIFNGDGITKTIYQILSLIS